MKRVVFALLSLVAFFLAIYLLWDPTLSESSELVDVELVPAEEVAVLNFGTNTVLRIKSHKEIFLPIELATSSHFITGLDSTNLKIKLDLRYRLGLLVRYSASQIMINNKLYDYEFGVCFGTKNDSCMNTVIPLATGIHFQGFKF